MKEKLKKRSIPASSIYTRLEMERLPFLKRAEKCSKLTLSYIQPEEGKDENDILEQKFTSFIAHAINNLSNKIKTSILPTGNSFFKLKADKSVYDELKDEQDKINKIEQDLIYIENTINNFVKTMNFGAKFIQAIKNLIITGNCLIEFIPGDNDDLIMAIYRLNKYVIKRDKKDYVKQIIIKEETYVDDLNEKYIDCGLENLQNLNRRSGNQNNKVINLYRVIRKEDNKYRTWQEFEDGTYIEETEKIYDKKVLPFLHLRWTSIYGEDYGRSMTEEYFADIKSFESINQIIQEFASVASKITYLINPNSYLTAQELNDSDTGDYLIGKEGDVTKIQSGLNVDFSIVDKVRSDLYSSLSKIFMIADSITRDAERVTAQEIQFMANELEKSLGGIYSNLSLEFQIPFVRILMEHLKIKLDEKIVKTTIITGLEGLGRNIELQKLNEFLQVLSITPQEELAKVNYKNLIEKYANYLNINIQGLFKTEDEIQNEQDIKTMQELVQNQIALQQQNRVQQQSQQQQQ